MIGEDLIMSPELVCRFHCKVQLWHFDETIAVKLNL